MSTGLVARVRFLLLIYLLCCASASMAVGQSVVEQPVGQEFCPVDRMDHLAAFDSPAFHEVVLPRWGLPIEPSGSFRHSAPARVFESDPAGGDAVEVLLQGLIGDGLSLDGEFVRAGSDRLDGAGMPASAPDGDFRFDPDTTEAVYCITDLSECPAFDAVNVYHHVDTYAREFWEGRMGLDIGFKAEARVHVAGDGAFADWTTRSLKLGVGDIFMKNSALSDDLIYHEYNHLILSSLGFLAGVGVSEQTRALHEAYADYFTATWTDDPRIGEWVVTCPPRQQCEGPPNSTDIRTLVLDAEEWNWRQGQPSNDLKYGICTRYHEGDLKCKQSWNNFTNPYIWGMIWAAALWDLRTAVGADVADRIALEAARQHTRMTGFKEAHAIIIETGHGLYGPNIADQVRQAFEQRGFLLSTGIDVDDGFTKAGLRLAIELWPNPTEEEIRLRIGSSNASGSSEWKIVDLLGRVVLEGSAGMDREWSIQLEDLPPGLYRARVRVNQQTGSRSFLKTR